MSRITFSFLEWRPLILSVIAGNLLLLSLVFYFQSMKLAEVSRVIPIYSFVPIMVAVLAAIFLNEVFSVMVYFGIILPVGGSWILSSGKLNKIPLGKAFRLMIASYTAYSLQFVMMKYLLNFNAYWDV